MIKQYLYNLATDKEKGISAGLPKAVLLLLSLIYGIALRVCRKLALSRAFRPSCKVISIGNITWGGTGKTSLVKLVLRVLKDNGRNPAVLIRGYGREDKNSPVIVKGRPEEFGIKGIGDEAYMLAEDFPDVPILIDANRRRSAAKAAGEIKADTVVLDDGFQHWKLERDLDIVLLNANDPFGNGRLIPRGILREPPSSLKRADIILFTKAGRQEREKLAALIKGINPSALMAYSDYVPRYFYDLADEKSTLEVDSLKGEAACVFSGIGDAGSFEKTVSECGVYIKLHLKFPDHHLYSDSDIIKIRAACRRNSINTVITSQKDAVRIKDCALFGGLRALALKAELEITHSKDEFVRRLLSLYTA